MATTRSNWIVLRTSKFVEFNGGDPYDTTVQFSERIGRPYKLANCSICGRLTARPGSIFRIQVGTDSRKYSACCPEHEDELAQRIQGIIDEFREEMVGYPYTIVNGCLKRHKLKQFSV